MIPVISEGLDKLVAEQLTKYVDRNRNRLEIGFPNLNSIDINRDIKKQNINNIPKKLNGFNL